MSEAKESRIPVLIAEDDPVSRRMLQAFLFKWGYDVVSAKDGLEAVGILEGNDAPPLAVLDWMMPGMEGPEVCRRVREIKGRPYIYVLLLTARTQKDDLLRGLESGADDYLTKPFDAQELRARLHVGQRILDLQRSLIETREELRFRATHDALTGIANRGVILDEAAREHSRRSREGGALGIIMTDLDHFKQVNDTCGHSGGDAVLKEASRRMTGCVRAYDMVGRYGGEEFLVVAPSTDALGTLRLAERMRAEIARQPVALDRGEIAITASFGVAVCTKEEPHDLPTLLRLADEALYRAKKNGRNRVELAESEVSISEVSISEKAESQGAAGQATDRGATPDSAESPAPVGSGQGVSQPADRVAAPLSSGSR
jgi:diguanylate cyclase (GGDEF)-like protein